MTYLITFLEGIITFISPCLLPMLPAYVTYFAGGGERSTRKTLTNALGFVLGFTVIFVALGALAGTIGGFLVRYQTALNIISGIIVIIFGLNFLGVFNIPALKLRSGDYPVKDLGFASSLAFGAVFSVAWTPCVGAFLGSALMLASRQGSTLAGMLMLLTYSVGLGIPFILSALLIDRLKNTFDFIKRHYKVINMVSGIFLIIVGILMMTGVLGRFLTFLS